MYMLLCSLRMEAILNTSPSCQKHQWEEVEQSALPLLVYDNAAHPQGSVCTCTPAIQP